MGAQAATRQRREKPWNRCDYCGRFISLAEFIRGRARRVLDTPDTAFTRETFHTYHVACRKPRRRS